jgi:hypothetical protein
LKTLTLPLRSLLSLSAAEAAPNILIVLADDLGYGDLACYGGKAVPTPALDALAADGKKFTAYTCAAAFIQDPPYTSTTVSVTFDVTIWVNSQITGDKLGSFKLRLNNNATNLSQWYGKESNLTGTHPELILTP